LSGLRPFPEADILEDQAANDLMKTHILKGTIESLEGLSLIFSMFAEDDKHNLPLAAEAAKSGRLKCIEAALAFNRAGNLIETHKVRQDVEEHVKSLNLDSTIQDWTKRGIIAPGTENLQLHADQRTLTEQVNFAKLVQSYAEKYDLLANYLEWPVENLVSNRYPFRDDMMRIFSTVSLVIHEASFLSQLFYEIPGKDRSHHMNWLNAQPSNP